jgi:predicted CXXCH cytochrome family protein
VKTLKRIFILVVCMLLVASAAFALVAGSKHDLTAYTGSTLSSCMYCHAPHNTAVGAPLWNKTMTGAAFTNYVLTNPGGVIGAPGTYSLVCLTCHDGTLNIGDTISNGTLVLSGTGNGTVALNAGNLDSGVAFIGTDLRSSHPVGVDYNAARAGLKAIDGAGANPIVTTGKRWQVYGAAAPFKVECSSCHNPHNEIAGTKMLKDVLATICSDCHANK